MSQERQTSAEEMAELTAFIGNAEVPLGVRFGVAMRGWLEVLEAELVEEMPAFGESQRGVMVAAYMGGMLLSAGSLYPEWAAGVVALLGRDGCQFDAPVVDELIATFPPELRPEVGA